MNISEQYSDKVKIVIGLVIFFIPVLLYSVHIPFYQNCLEVTRWLLIYAGVGAGLGLLFGFYWIREKEDDFQKLQICIAAVVIGIIVLPLLLTLVNRIPFLQKIEESKVEVISIESFKQSRFGEIDLEENPDGYYVYCLYGADIFRLQSYDQKRLQELEKGKPTKITVHHGPLGLRWANWP